MNSELELGLDQTGWPVLLVDAQGGICRANARALSYFGPAVDGPNARLSAIWPGDNPGGSVEQFLSQWIQAKPPMVWLKLKVKSGATASCQVLISLATADNQSWLLWQILPEMPVAPTGPTAGVRPATDVATKQKLDCALQLARTVALDFNNALTSILGHTSLVLSKMEPTHPWRSSLIEVEKSAAKAAEIANDLGTFSRQDKETRTQTAGNLNILAQRAVEFLQQNTGDAHLQWSLQLERQLYAARFDEAKLQQALIKILENAVESLRGGGRVGVQTRNLDLAESTQDRNVQLAPGAYVCVEINDTGGGIAADVLPRIFEPFFTTKGGKHRGLGLAWVYGIITNHGGGVAVSSQPDQGTSVRIYLPAEQRIISGAIRTDDLTGTETVLMVDDEELLLTMGQTILSAYGYKVLTANNGQKALEMLNTPQCPVGLVITDLVMPGMSGRELIEQIQKLPLKVKVLCTSGYVWPSSQEKDGAYLKKPFTAQELLHKVKHVLST